MNTLTECTVPPDTDNTGDAMQSFNRVWREVHERVKGTARALARDRAEREELIQAARIWLMEIDGSRCDIRDPKAIAYLRAALENLIRQEARRLRREARFLGAGEVPEDVRKQLQC